MRISFFRLASSISHVATAISICTMLLMVMKSNAMAFTKELLGASSIQALNEAVKVTSMNARRQRACQIQHLQRIPPTMCYGLSRSVAELDSLCLRLSHTILQIPKVDENTSATCREAIEKRRADLAYARP